MLHRTSGQSVESPLSSSHSGPSIEGVHRFRGPFRSVPAITPGSHEPVMWNLARSSATCSSNNAVEQTASTARPWRGAQRRQIRLRGPRPVPRPPLLTAGVTKATDVLSRNAEFGSVPARCTGVQTAALAASRKRAT